MKKYIYLSLFIFLFDTLKCIKEEIPEYGKKRDKVGKDSMDLSKSLIYDLDQNQGDDDASGSLENPETSGSGYQVGGNIENSGSSSYSQGNYKDGYNTDSFKGGSNTDNTNDIFAQEGLTDNKGYSADYMKEYAGGRGEFEHDIGYDTHGMRNRNHHGTGTQNWRHHLGGGSGQGGHSWGGSSQGGHSWGGSGGDHQEGGENSWGSSGGNHQEKGEHSWESSGGDHQEREGSVWGYSGRNQQEGGEHSMESTGEESHDEGKNHFESSTDNQSDKGYHEENSKYPASNSYEGSSGKSSGHSWNPPKETHQSSFHGAGSMSSFGTKPKHPSLSSYDSKLSPQNQGKPDSYHSMSGNTLPPKAVESDECSQCNCNPCPTLDINVPLFCSSCPDCSNCHQPQVCEPEFIASRCCNPLYVDMSTNPPCNYFDVQNCKQHDLKFSSASNQFFFVDLGLKTKWNDNMNNINSNISQFIRNQVQDFLLRVYADYDYYHETWLLKIVQSGGYPTAKCLIRFTKEVPGNIALLEKTIKCGCGCYFIQPGSVNIEGTNQTEVLKHCPHRCRIPSTKCGSSSSSCMSMCCVMKPVIIDHPVDAPDHELTTLGIHFTTPKPNIMDIPNSSYPKECPLSCFDTCEEVCPDNCCHHAEKFDYKHQKRDRIEPEN